MPGDFENADAYDLNKDYAGNINSCGDGDGDGDGLLEGPGSSNVIFYNEIKNYFIHLSNADLIDQKITNEPRPGGTCNFVNTKGIGYPEAKIGESIIALQDVNRGSMHFVLGGFGSTHSHVIDGGAYNLRGLTGDHLTTKQASKTDKKIDNGNPLTGKLRPVLNHVKKDGYSLGYFNFDYNGNEENCIYNNEYNISYSDPSCTLSIEYDR